MEKGKGRHIGEFILIFLVICLCFIGVGVETIGTLFKAICFVFGLSFCVIYFMHALSYSEDDVWKNVFLSLSMLVGMILKVVGRIGIINFTYISCVIMIESALLLLIIFFVGMMAED